VCSAAFKKTFSRLGEIARKTGAQLEQRSDAPVTSTEPAPGAAAQPQHS